MPSIFVYLWFDVQDYVTPRSDEPPKKIVEILTRNGIDATFKVVAEKIRALESHQRQDVTAALATMNIGYHLDPYSRHPTLPEYLGDKDVRAGSDEFFKREDEGRSYVEKSLRQAPWCLGHPGPAWTPGLILFPICFKLVDF